MGLSAEAATLTRIWWGPGSGSGRSAISTPTFKLGFGHYPLWAFCDHGPAASGEPLSQECHGIDAGNPLIIDVDATLVTAHSDKEGAKLLRPSNAGSNTAEDHITVIRAAWRQLSSHQTGNRPGRKILIRIDSAGATHDLLNWITRHRLSYSVGFSLPASIVDELAPHRLGPDARPHRSPGPPLGIQPATARTSGRS
jgi:hypothetical protein